VICYRKYTNNVKTCPDGENVCYTKMWCDGFCTSRGKVVELGCAATCPIRKPGNEVKCCSTNKCNHPPKRKKRRP
uniref:Alpha-elapitoxin-Aa2d n=1 Tax=Acanthophis antarcticus TaxID=8605 RepID=3L2D_ACAAN|nr:RecName: Full=Alpha-elapitoxin-Aa2d; Short=Alpha-EPTX-Aa2d; AltName: Full=Acanthophin-D; AltName: Full=Postsynaptic neurotoxin [Acanthophis antarcticus]